jgi:hypothetical protein
MKALLRAGTLVSAVLLATGAQAWTQIRTEAEFRAQIVGRAQVVEGRGQITSTADGAVTGQWQNQPLRGRWQWHEGAWCRNLIVGNTETGTNCLRVEIRGNQVRTTQDRGRGAATISTLN